MEYTVHTRAGKTFTVESDLSTGDAIRVLANKAERSNFERDLIDKRRVLSAKQRAWVHVLASWAQNPREDNGGAAFPAIYALLTKAREAGKKFPKIKLSVDGQRVVLALSGKGKVNVTDGRPYGSNTYFGAIQQDGNFRASRDAGSVMVTLEALEANPAKVAAQHGVATGNCCFCAKDLTTKESRSVGYGPVCADRHGLPWGAIDPDLDNAGKEEVSI